MNWRGIDVYPELTFSFTSYRTRSVLRKLYFLPIFACKSLRPTRLPQRDINFRNIIPRCWAVIPGALPYWVSLIGSERTGDNLTPLYIQRIFYCVGGVRMNPFGTYRSLLGPLYQPPIIDEYVGVGRMRIGRRNRCTGRNLPQCRFVNYKSHMTWTRLEPGLPWWEAGRLTAWAMIRSVKGNRQAICSPMFSYEMPTVFCIKKVTSI
jgi:hypothetical protein